MRNKIIIERIYLNYKCFKKTPSTLIFSHYLHNLTTPTSKKAAFLYSFKTSPTVFPKPTSTLLRYSTTAGSAITEQTHQDPNSDDSNEEMEPIDSWEEEDEAEPEVGDGGDGGGVVLQNCPWGERALGLAQEVLQQFGDGMELYAFKTSHRGYVYVRLDKLSNEYWCPTMDDIESFSRQYKKRLDEVGAAEEILPNDLALEVSSPGADRLLRVPDDLLRFQEMPMVVSHTEDSNARFPEKNGVYFLDSIETESRCCVWKLADVKENRDPSAKGRPLSRKQKDWRLKLQYDMIKQLTGWSWVVLSK